LPFQGGSAVPTLVYSNVEGKSSGPVSLKSRHSSTISSNRTKSHATRNHKTCHQNFGQKPNAKTQTGHGTFISVHVVSIVLFDDLVKSLVLDTSHAFTIVATNHLADPQSRPSPRYRLERRGKAIEGTAGDGKC
jgi:hypothetical protein